MIALDRFDSAENCVETESIYAGLRFYEAPVKNLIRTRLASSIGIIVEVVASSLDSMDLPVSMYQLDQYAHSNMIIKLP
ncbi:hypothetical protein B9Z55_027976 [Caenorhabditis nigoni]|uniref:Uncharacterized protein n=1 Tax=Caenorhabditis nigoni TaxID=1611254 RepID=A0A2G5SDH7_9PELO|nr:hypothetical protein B9Z55_027976 [Caenorhabditis nigoni]